MVELFLIDLELKLKKAQRCEIKNDGLIIAENCTKNENLNDAIFEKNTESKVYNRSTKLFRNNPKEPVFKQRPEEDNCSYHNVITKKESKGAVHALYQAIAMVQSPEFLKEIEPERSPMKIINRMYAVSG